MKKLVLSLLVVVLLVPVFSNAFNLDPLKLKGLSKDQQAVVENYMKLDTALRKKFVTENDMQGCMSIAEQMGKLLPAILAFDRNRVSKAEAYHEFEQSFKRDPITLNQEAVLVMIMLKYKLGCIMVGGG